MSSALCVIVLAAGQGTRMKSKTPKVMHLLAGVPLVGHVLNTANALNNQKTIIVQSKDSQLLDTYLETHQPNILKVCQDKQLGTGHAVQQALPRIDCHESLLILYGDVPLIRPDTLRSLLEITQDLGVLTLQIDNPTGYGRIVRDNKGQLARIVEHKDANQKELSIREVNTGILCVSGAHLKSLLPKLHNDNSQQEYYLTDLIALAVEANLDIKTLTVTDPVEVQGVNDLSQLAALERAFQKNQAQLFMKEGLYLSDPDRFDLRGQLTFGKDVRIDVGVIIEGQVTLENGVVVGPYSVLKDVHIGENTQIKSHTVIEDAKIGAECDIGPYARIRPGTQLGEHAKIGNFVETKKAIIGNKSKVNHLSYVGDAEIGEEVNVGAGTITCNYDGANKHKTCINSGAFIGSNTALVAPVKIGKGATVGAGSTITKDIPDAALGIARGRQVKIDSWKRPEKLF